MVFKTLSNGTFSPELAQRDGKVIDVKYYLLEFIMGHKIQCYVTILMENQYK